MAKVVFSTLDLHSAEAERGRGSQELLTARDGEQPDTMRSAPTLLGSLSPRTAHGEGAGGGGPHTSLRASQPRAEPEPHVSRYGYVSTKRALNAVPFGNAPKFGREQLPGGATVPFTYVPKAFDERDFDAEHKNAGAVPFTTSTREQWDRTHNSAQSSAGPGAYDIERADPHISGHKVTKGVPFTTATRQTYVPFNTPGPLDYHAMEQHEAYLLKQAPRMPFTTAERVMDVPHPGPAPHDTRSAWEAVQGKHAYSYKFTTAPAHEASSVDVATASVPMYGGERVARRPTKSVIMGRAKRW